MLIHFIFGFDVFFHLNTMLQITYITFTTMKMITYLFADTWLPYSWGYRNSIFKLILSDLFLSGKLGSQWLASDFSLCRWSGCNKRSCHQCWTGDDGERWQGLSQTGEGQPDGRVEVLHFLGVSGIPPVGTTLRGICKESEEDIYIKKRSSNPVDAFSYQLNVHYAAIVPVMYFSCPFKAQSANGSSALASSRPLRMFYQAMLNSDPWPNWHTRSGLSFVVTHKTNSWCSEHL